MHDWIAAAEDDLGIDLDVDVTGLLDMTKVVAHEVARPAAPVTSFLVGYAAALRGGGPEAVARANRLVTELAARWASKHESGTTAS
ncbi:DUF6457 domain-containing protein [Streptomyces sp. NPDC002523]